MKKLVILIALILVIVHSARLISRLNRVISKAMYTKDRKLLPASQEELE